MKKTALAYVRKSVMDTPDPSASSPVRQRNAIERWAADRWLFEWFEDLDISGYHESNRPGWLALLARLDDPDVELVIVEDYRSTHRNLKEFLAFQDKLVAIGKRLVWVYHPSLDPSTADGRLQISQLMALAEWERNKASERQKQAKLALQTNQGIHVGQIPFGCVRDPHTKHLIPAPDIYFYNPTTATATTATDNAPPAGYETRRYYDALRALYDIFSTGKYSYDETARQLNAAGWRGWKKHRGTPKVPQPFTPATIRSIAQRWPVYAGELLAHWRTGDPKTLPGAHAPILPMALCRRVGQVRDQRFIVRQSYQNYHVYLLSSLLYCAACGAALGGSSRDGVLSYRHRHARQNCNERRVRVAIIDDQIKALFDQIVRHQQLINDVTAKIHQALIEAQQETPSAHDLDNARAELERLIDLRVDGIITKPQFISRQVLLQTKIEQLEQDRAPASTAPAVVLEITGAITRWTDADILTKKQILNSFIERIEVHNRTISKIQLKPWAKEFIDVCHLCAELGPTRLTMC